MSRAAQAVQPWISGGPGQGARLAALFCACMALSACGAGGFSLAKADVDRSLYTSNVPATRTPADAERLSDEATIRNAVTSADIEALGGAPLPWANADTGSRGQIADIVEKKGEGKLCRQFSATRESFDGVAMLRGEACMVSAGIWRIERFKAL
ncbi:RT0821/Lpp0805 family surface protein [Mesorhizobium marinum]|uniref:RT0821/Lpp0805 family surface protein n=1 Tax=Mesorhizobium marinum TaxID=3228790 RepID=UPI00346580CE